MYKEASDSLLRGASGMRGRLMTTCWEGRIMPGTSPRLRMTRARICARRFVLSMAASLHGVVPSSGRIPCDDEALQREAVPPLTQHAVPLPPRPAIPLALWTLAGACACQLAIARVSMPTDDGVELPLGVMGACVYALALLCAWLAARRHTQCERSITQALVAALACLLCASASACLSNMRGVLTAQSLASSSMSRWSFEVVNEPSATDTGYRCRARASKPGSPAGDVWLVTKEAFERGTVLTCIGRYHALSYDAYGTSSWCQGVRGSVTTVRVLDMRRCRRLTRFMQDVRVWVLNRIKPQHSEARALLAGCVCGSRRALDDGGLTDQFASCGLAHLVAVSGAHLSVITLMVSAFLEHLHMRVKSRLLMLAAITGLFVVFCGSPISAVRAWLMLMVAYASQLAGRRSDALTSVSIVALFMVLLDPTIAGQLAFQLSVLSVVGLCLFTQHASYVLRTMASPVRLPRFVPLGLRRLFDEGKDAVCDILAATLVCQMVTLPLCLPIFGKLSLVAPLASLVATPLMSALMGAGMVACLLIWLPCAALILDACDVAARPLLAMVHTLARLPCATIPAASYGMAVPLVTMVLLVVWLVWWPQVNRRVVGAICACVTLAALGVYAYWRCFAPARIVVLDVGQGDAILVQDGSGAILVDTGPDDAIVAALARRHVLHLDAVILTHLHDDHYGGLQHLVGSIDCEKVLVASGVAEAMPHELMAACDGLAHGRIEELSYGDALALGGFCLRMIWPHEAVDGDENSESVELMVSYHHLGRSLSALLSGDAEQDELAACLQAGDVGDIDMLKVGHHGSEISLTPGQASSIDPELAVASAGEGNRYGHPTEACVDALLTAGATFLCTKDAGDVEVRPGADGLVVHTYGTGAANGTAFRGQ